MKKKEVQKNTPNIQKYIYIRKYTRNCHTPAQPPPLVQQYESTRNMLFLVGTGLGVYFPIPATSSPMLL